MTDSPKQIHDGLVSEALTADGVPETDPRWAGWWARCSCGWETFETLRDDAQHALDLHLAYPEEHSPA